MQAMKSGKGVAFAVFGVALSCAASAHASVTISSAATTNMTCSGGVCAPTAKNAVLNVGDLETLLASGNVTVTTTGTGVQASDIDIKSALGWSSAGALSLLAKKSIEIASPVSITGLSGLTVTTGTKGTFSFGKKGSVTFSNLSSKLIINGGTYTLVGDIQTLASDIAANPNGDFALAGNYDASGWGGSTPIPTIFNGTFEGLGNTISNLDIARAALVNGFYYQALFAVLGATGTVADIGLVNVSVTTSVKNVGAATLVGVSSGTIMFCYASGVVVSKKEGGPGGLVGGNSGTIANSYAAVTVTGGKGRNGLPTGGLVAENSGNIVKSYATGATNGSSAGGLVGQNYGDISSSYAKGNVSGLVGGGLVGFNSGAVTDSYALGNAKGGVSGGLIGEASGTISNSYAMGNVTGSNDAGGLVGDNGATISFSYSTGTVTGAATIGGLIGDDEAQPGSITDSYWDTDTSGIMNLGQGAGNIANDPGITGLTTAQFQSGLPAGFDPTVWAENANIDDGFPYLLANPPAK